jgi:hypothetical protein
MKGSNEKYLLQMARSICGDEAELKPIPFPQQNLSSHSE